MKTWIHTHWRAILLNTLGLAALLAVTRLPRASQFSGVSEPMVAAGIWAARFLLITLAITPLNTVFGWRSLLRLRRTAGLWTFAFAALHFGYYVWDSKASWLQTPIPNTAAAIGLAALLILTALAVTSTNAAQRRMGKWWTRLHKLVYAAGVLGLVHGLLETGNKFVAMNQPESANEIWLYLGLLAALLAVRIPPLRRYMAGLRHRRTPAAPAAGEVA
ncbi:MAG: ferric reductase-like transmembrane domain-containing protein [Anaerolineales bacterium]|nr:MAG: ferric reductase-like transmembrane domain-containing protein [Anaerolineales bacterium]